MPYIKLSDFIFDCSVCHTRCDGISKGSYIFDNDISFSESFEERLIEKINSTQKYSAAKTSEAGFPDIQIKKDDGSVYCYLEVKVQQRTFMQVKKYFPQSKLEPSETVALNLSDLTQVFQHSKKYGRTYHHCLVFA